MFTRKSFLFNWTHLSVSILLVMSMLIGIAPPALAAPTAGNPGVYTLDADFEEGTLVNVNYTDVPDQLQLDSESTPFDFIWVAVSTKGTVVKIDTETGAVLGEYHSTPANQGFGDPSRTTVDIDGSVWVANRRDVWGGYGTVLHIGLRENNQCEDRNGNGTIDTSGGLGDVRAWPDNSGARGVATAADECIVHYVQTNSRGTRHVSINADNDVWVSGVNLRNFALIKGGRFDVPMSGQILRTETQVGYGGYGGLIDPNGVIWSARDLLRWNTANPLSGPNGDPAGSSIGPPAPGTYWSGQSDDSYGLCIDSQGNVWNTQLGGGLIHKYAPNGALLGAFAHGNYYAQGCVVDGNDHVWVAHSLISNYNTVGHLLNNGAHLGNVTLDPSSAAMPTGVAVDRNGKIWATGYQTQKVYRIDPASGPIGADGLTPVGAVDLTTVALGGNLYNYSDMTGSTLIEPPSSGAWTIVHDSGIPGAVWGKVTWTADTPSDSALIVTAASSTDGVTFGPEETVTNGVDLTTVADGQYLKVMVTFQRATTDESPVLYDLTILANQPPVADANGPYTMNEGDTIMLDSSASSDPDGDLLTHAWDLDNDGTFETPGVTPAYFRPDGPATYPVSVEVCDPYGECDTDTAMVEVANVPPTANAGPDQTVYRNDLVTLHGAWTDPATTYDNPYAWTWDLNGDGTADESGSAGYGTSIDRTTAFALDGSYTLAFGVTDKDTDSGSDTVLITVLNRPPVCTAAAPSISTIWPVNHKFVPVTVLGVTDPEGDPVVTTITSIFQDEPVDTTGDGKFVPDGKGVGTATAEVRAERTGTPKVPGNGRVYHIGFAADDGHGGLCTGEVRVGVPHDQSKPVVDDGALYDSTVPVSGVQGEPGEMASSLFLPLVRR